MGLFSGVDDVVNVDTESQTNVELFPQATFRTQPLNTLMQGLPGYAQFSGPYGSAFQAMINYMSGAAPKYRERNVARVERAGEKLGEISGLQQAMGNTGALTGGQVQNATDIAKGAAYASGVAAETADEQQRRNLIPQFLSMVQAPAETRASAPWRVTRHSNVTTTTQGPTFVEGVASLMGMYLSNYTGGGSLAGNDEDTDPTGEG